MAAVDVYGPSLSEKEQMDGAAGVQQFHGSGAVTPAVQPTSTSQVMGKPSPVMDTSQIMGQPSPAVGKSSTVNDIVGRLMNSAGNTYRQARPEAVADPSTGMGWKDAVNYAMGQLSNKSWMNLGSGTRKGQNAAAELGAILQPAMQAYGSEIGAKTDFARGKTVSNAAVAGNQLEFGEKQLGLAGDMTTAAVNADHYADWNANQIADRNEDKRWHDMQYGVSKERNNISRSKGSGRGGGSAKLLPGQKEEMKAIDDAAKAWNSTRAATLKQEAADTKNLGAVGPGYKAMREQQNEQRRSLESQMQAYRDKYGQSYTGPAAVAPRRQAAQPKRSQTYNDLRKEIMGK